ncbi:MAG: C10 family peptidase [Verrucomicrobiota bacterium]
MNALSAFWVLSRRYFQRGALRRDKDGPDDPGPRRHNAPMAKRRRRMFFVIACAGLFSRELPAAPVDESAARRVAQTLLGLTHPAATFAKSPSAAKGKVALAIVRVTPVRHAGETVGYVAALAPAGFILLRADDQAPPVKLSSDAGRIDQLPPSFLELVERELAAELGVIRMSKFGQSSRLSNYQTQWAALLKGERPGASTGAALLAGSSPGAVLLQTSWDQSSPYNYYCPVYGYFLGEALRTPVGCVPTALGQILRYHQQPAAVTQDASYSDSQGSLRGVHATSDAEMTPYRWSSMPFALEESSPAVEIEAVGQLLYHVAVAVEADFEQSQTSAYSYSVQRPLFKQFQYVSTGFQERSGLTTAQWYNKVATEIDAARPIFYRLASATKSSSHALVCDGYRNGNEIHLNMGWAVGRATPGITWTPSSTFLSIRRRIGWCTQACLA